MTNTLHLTVGLPRSGKSTWARSTGWPIVSPDAIRQAVHGQPFLSSAEPFVWMVAHRMVEALFLAGHTHVVLDATNVSRERRDEWIGPWAREFVLFPTATATCMERAIVAPHGALLIPVIHRMAARLEWPDEDEGPQRTEAP